MGNKDVYLVAPDGSHVFFDVSYGEENPLLSIAMPETIPKGHDIFFPEKYKDISRGDGAHSGHNKMKKFGIWFGRHDKCTESNNVGDKVVLIVGTEKGLGDQLWWGMWQEDADNLQTFFCSDPDNVDTWDGGSVVIKNMNDRKWLVIISDPATRKVGLFSSVMEIRDATILTVRLVNRPVPPVH